MKEADSDQEKHGRGRPPIEIDLAELESLSECGCTNREIAAHFGCSERLIELRRRDPEFRAAMERGAAHANISLRQKQLKVALAGDRTMLIWLGKQRLGQSDKVNTEHSVAEDTGPLKINVNFVSAKKKQEAA